MKILDTRSIYYDDINLISSYNPHIASRKDIPEEKWRIFVSPMPSVVGERFALEALKLGLSVCLHRFSSIDDNIKLFKTIYKEYPELADVKTGRKAGIDTRLWGSIGLNDNERFKKLRKVGCNNFIIDTANAYLRTVMDYAAEIDTLLSLDEKLMVGNVHTKSICDMWAARLPGVYIRVGIGGGSGCETTSMTAVNRGQITEISECAPKTEQDDYHILADGSISKPANAVKAFGAGAENVMLGGYFSYAEEAQNIIDGEYKFWGCASHYNQEKYGSIRRHSEGRVLELDKTKIKPLKVLVDDLWGGISSGVSYAGYKSLSDFIGEGVFELKQ